MQPALSDPVGKEAKELIPWPYSPPSLDLLGSALLEPGQKPESGTTHTSHSPRAKSGREKGDGGVNTERYMEDSWQRAKDQEFSADVPDIRGLFEINRRWQQGSCLYGCSSGQGLSWRYTLSTQMLFKATRLKAIIKEVWREKRTKGRDLRIIWLRERKESLRVWSLEGRWVKSEPRKEGGGRPNAGVTGAHRSTWRKYKTWYHWWPHCVVVEPEGPELDCRACQKEQEGAEDWRLQAWATVATGEKTGEGALAGNVESRKADF